MDIRNRKGSALMEMAFMLPVLVALTVGVFEFGRVMFIKNSLNYAAREGARQASVSDPFNSAAVQGQVTVSLPAALQAGVVITITPAAPRHGIDTVKVAVSAPFTTVVPNFLKQLANITTLSAEASMRYELFRLTATEEP